MRCYLVLFSLFIIIVQSCTKEPQYIDTSKESDNLYIVESDTVQPLYTVYRVDSFQTSGTSRSIIGQNTDPYFGFTTSRSFCRFKIAADNYLNVGTQTETYDSIALIMHGDKTFYGDTTLPWTASVHALTQDLNAINTYYYNQNELSISPDELGTISRIVRPNVDDSVVIRLTDSFGAAIFNLYKNKNEAVFNQDAFQQYLKGLCIQTAGSGNVIYGFNAADSATLIRLYYHDDQGAHVNKVLDFKSQAGNYQFNNIKNDPTGTVTAIIVPGHDTPSDSLGHQFFVCDLAGIGTRFTLPTVKTLATIPDFVRLQSMSLKVSPVPNSFNNYPLINKMGLSYSDQSSSNLTPLFSSDNTTIQTGNLNIDNLNGVNTGYTFDLGAFSRAEIVSTAYTTRTLYLQPLSSSNARTFTLNRVVAADNANPNLPSKVITQMLFFKK